MKQRLHAWIVCIIGASFVGYQFMLQTSTSVMIAGIKQSFSVGVVDVSFLSSTFFYTYLLLQVPGGMLIDRFQPRWVLTAGVTVLIIASILFARADSLLVAEFSRMLMGIAAAPGVAGALCLTNNWFPPSRFALMAGIVEMLGMFGGALGEWGLGTLVESQLSWRGSMWVCIAIGAFMLLMMLLFLRNRPAQPVAARVSTEVEPLPSHIALFRLIKMPQIWIAAIYGGCVFAVIGGFASFWCVPFLQKLYGLREAEAGSTAALLLIGVAFGAPLIGWLSDVWQQRRLLMIGYAIAIGLGSLVVTQVPMTLLEMKACLLVLGFLSGSYVLPFAVIRDRVSEKIQGTAMAFTNMMAILIGAPVLQPLVGLLLRHYWDGATLGGEVVYSVAAYRSALWPLPLGLLIATVLAFMVRETQTSPTAQYDNNHQRSDLQHS